MNYQHRIIEPALREYLSSFSVVGITGPRQSGKSTLLLECLTPGYRYVTFDDYGVIERFEHDPEKFMSVHNDRVIFDEAQKAPEIFNYVKIAVDRDRANAGKYVVTGSSRFSFIKEITESLAGRIGLLQLLPFQFAEISKDLRQQSMYLGGYPELIQNKYRHADYWYGAYLETYLEKDVRSLANIVELADFRRLIKLLATNTSQLLNLSNYAKHLGVTVSTIKRWISILEASYIIFLLPPYSENHGKRLIKSSKIYFYDTGLAAHLTRMNSENLFNDGPMSGALFENYIISEIYKNKLHRKQKCDLYFYRTSHGQEVDLIIDRGTAKDYIEIKHSATLKTKMLETVESLVTEKDRGILIYQGKDITYDHNINAINYQNYLDSLSSNSADAV